MFWAFAKVNNRLAEVYFEEKRGKIRVFTHCYVRPEEYETKREKKQIEDDTAKLKFTYRNGSYKRVDEKK